MKNWIMFVIGALAAGCGDPGVPVPVVHPDLAVTPPDLTWCSDVVVSQSLVGGINLAHAGERDATLVRVIIHNRTCRDVLVQPIEVTISYIKKEVGSLRGSKGTPYVSRISLMTGDPPRLEDGPYEVRNPGPVSEYHRIMTFNPNPLRIQAKEIVVVSLHADLGYEDGEGEFIGHTLRATLGDLGNNWLLAPGGVCFADNPLCLNSPDQPKVNGNRAYGESTTILP